MTKTVKVTFVIKNTEISVQSGVPMLKDGINHDNMIVLNAKAIIERDLGLNVYKLLNAEHYDDIKNNVTIDKSSYK